MYAQKFKSAGLEIQFYISNLFICGSFTLKRYQQLELFISLFQKSKRSEEHCTFEILNEIFLSLPISTVK